MYSEILGYIANPNEIKEDKIGIESESCFVKNNKKNRIYHIIFSIVMINLGILSAILSDGDITGFIVILFLSIATLLNK